MPKTKKEESKEKVKLLKPKNDVVFQSLFNQNNEKITKDFVQALLEEKIESIVINRDKELAKERPEDKLGILDLEIDVNNNEKIDVEIQLMEKKNFAERLLFYFSKLYQTQIKRGDDYTKAKRVVLIAILDYKLELTKELEQMETIWQLREKMHSELLLTNSIEIHIIELNKVRDIYNKNRDNKKAQWMLFLDDPNSKEVQEIMEKNEEIKEATIIVREMSEDERLRRLADLREKAIMDEKAIYAAGVDKGIKQRNIEIAEQLLRKNMSIDEVSQITTLDIEEVKEILETIKQQ